MYNRHQDYPRESCPMDRHQGISPDISPSSCTCPPKRIHLFIPGYSETYFTNISAHQSPASSCKAHPASSFCTEQGEAPAFTGPLERAEPAQVPAGAGAWCDTGETRCPLCTVSGSESPLHCQPFSERRDTASGCCGNSHAEMGLTGSFIPCQAMPCHAIPCHAIPGRVTEVPAAPQAQAHTLLFCSPGNASSHVQGVTHSAGRAVGLEGGREC